MISQKKIKRHLTIVIGLPTPVVTFVALLAIEGTVVPVSETRLRCKMKVKAHAYYKWFKPPCFVDASFHDAIASPVHLVAPAFRAVSTSAHQR